MLNKLQGIKARYEELTHTLSRPEAMADQAAWRDMVARPAGGDRNGIRRIYQGGPGCRGL